VRFIQILPAIAVDVICITIFAIIGRSSHQEATDLLGVVHTAWPFLAGCLVGTVIGRTWRHPLSLTSGVAVWLGAVVGGMTLRLVTGAGAAVIRPRCQLRTRPPSHRLARRASAHPARQGEDFNGATR